MILVSKNQLISNYSKISGNFFFQTTLSIPGEFHRNENTFLDIYHCKLGTSFIDSGILETPPTFFLTYMYISGNFSFAIMQNSRRRFIFVCELKLKVIEETF